MRHMRMAASHLNSPSGRAVQAGSLHSSQLCKGRATRFAKIGGEMISLAAAGPWRPSCGLRPSQGSSANPTRAAASAWCSSPSTRAPPAPASRPTPEPKAPPI
jgi:hypothetical protein